MKKEEEDEEGEEKKNKEDRTKNTLFFILSSFFCLFFSYFFHHFLLCTVCHLQQRTRRRETEEETEEEIFFACQRAPLHKEKKTKTVQFCNQWNRTKTGSTAPVRGFYGRTGGFRFLVYFSNFSVFLENWTELDTGPRLNRLNRPVRSGF